MVNKHEVTYQNGLIMALASSSFRKIQHALPTPVVPVKILPEPSTRPATNTEKCFCNGLTDGLSKYASLLSENRGEL